MAGKEGAREGANASAAAVSTAAEGELSTKVIPRRTTSQEVSWVEVVPLEPRTAAAEVGYSRAYIIAARHGGWGVCATDGLWKSTEKSACPRKRELPIWAFFEVFAVCQPSTCRSLSSHNVLPSALSRGNLSGL